MPIISANAICVTYPNNVEALRSFSLEMGRGEFVAIVGPSGCGKSTFLRVLAGLLKPTSGSVILDGEPVTQPSRHVSILFQEPALLPWRTVERNLQLPLEVGGKGKKSEARGQKSETEMDQNSPLSSLQSRVSDLIRLVGLEGFERAWPRELSGGMARRVALARALITQPPVLLLDEPFGALDALTRESLITALESIWRGANTTGLMVTHSIRESIFLADRVVICAPRPGQVAGIVPINLPRPRSWEMESQPEFIASKNEIRAILSI